MSSVTAGPWKATDENGRYDNRKNSWNVTDENASCSEAAPITTEDGTVVAFAVASSRHYYREDRTGEIANLISAAPKMRDLLMELVNIEGPLPGNAEWAHKVKEVLAKATGEA